MSSPDTAPYEVLTRTIERELELIGQGRFQEAREVQSGRAALMASLPDVPPAGARPALQRASLLCKRLEIEILRCREALLLDLAQVEIVQRTARGYTPPLQARPNVQATA